MSKVNGIIAWFICTIYVLYTFALNTASAVISPAIQSSFKLTNIEATIAVTAFIVGFACMQIPAGYLLDRYPLRLVVGGGVLILSVGTLLASFSTNLLGFSLSNLIQGIGASFAFVAAGVLIGQWFSQKAFPVLFGLTQTLSCIFAGFLHNTFIVMLKAYTWQHLYFFLSIFGFILLVFSVIFVRNPKSFTPNKQLSLLKSLKIVCSNGQLWFCVLGAATAFGTLLSYAGFWYVRVQKYFDVTRKESLLISWLIFIGIGFGTPLSGWISNMVKTRKNTINVALTIGTILLLAVLFLPRFHIHTLLPIKLLSFLLGLFISGSMLYYTIVSEIFDLSFKGVALSVTNTGVFIFNSFLMFIPYPLLEISPTYFTSLWILPAFVVISLGSLNFIRETYDKSSS